jgi:hypothetical protein
MQRPAARRLSLIATSAILLAVASGCGNDSPTAPTLEQKTETFTGTLQPLGLDYKTFNIEYRQGASELSLSVDNLVTTAGGAPVTGITIGVGVGTLAGSVCSLQLQTPAATIGQVLFAPNGAQAGTYCMQIYDCPTGATGCTPMLTEAVNYTMTVKHY